MKKNLILALLFSFGFSFALSSQVSDKTKKDIENGSWYKKSPAQSIYGIDLGGAEELMKTSKVKKTPIVAIIGAGVDTEHEALKHAIWTNPKEKENGKDDNKNGYIDDLHGWNFISNTNGEIMENTMTQADREWLKLKDKYADYIQVGTIFYKYIDSVRTVASPPEDMKEFKYFRSLEIPNTSEMGVKHSSYRFSYEMKKNILNWDKLLLKELPDKSRKDITKDDFKKYVVPTVDVNDTLTVASMVFADLSMGFLKGTNEENSPWDYLYRSIKNRQIGRTYKTYTDYVEQQDVEQRKRIVGDNPYDINDKKYGSNLLLTSNSGSSTLYSGLIAGKNTEQGFEGIVPDAKIINLVTTAAAGDPLVKDQVLSIRYAVDNGADVIVLQQQRFCNDTDVKWLDEAIRYADKKGVTVIVGVWEWANDMSKVKYYPSQEMLPGVKYDNLISVACSDSLGMPSTTTNYGVEGVDLFAPGRYIYSTLPGDMYSTVNSSLLGAVTTAGVVAYIKSYFPKLKPAELKKILMNGVTDRKDEEVEINVQVKDKQIKEQFLFGQLCKSGGILNLNNSLKLLMNK